MSLYFVEKSPSKAPVATASPSASRPSAPPVPADPSNQDNLFSEFRHLCGRLEREPKYNGKTKLVSDFIKNGSSGGKGVCVWGGGGEGGGVCVQGCMYVCVTVYEN